MRDHGHELCCSNTAGPYTLPDCGGTDLYLQSRALTVTLGKKIHLTISCHHCFSSRSFGDQCPACGLVLGTSGLLFFSLLLWVYIQFCERARRKLQRKGVQCTTGLPHNLSQKIAFIFLLEKLVIKFLSCLCTDLDNNQPLPESLNKSGLRETHVPMVMDISRHSLSLPSQAHLF